jgi:hypothetical protein
VAVAVPVALLPVAVPVPVALLPVAVPVPVALLLVAVLVPVALLPVAVLVPVALLPVEVPVPVLVLDESSPPPHPEVMVMTRARVKARIDPRISYSLRPSGAAGQSSLRFAADLLQQKTGAPGIARTG